MKSERNKTIILTEDEELELAKELITNITKKQKNVDKILNKVIHQDTFKTLEYLPSSSVDLLIIDPPYNLNKNFGAVNFRKTSTDKYKEYLNTLLEKTVHTLKENATIYICGDWHSSIAIADVASKYFTLQNRISWQREKGRGSKINWKNSSEDIWFCTNHKTDYTFNVDKIKQRKQVIAPYKTEDGEPKDWSETEDGKFRDTHPSNFWNDITVPYWSMAENTPHPTQKPEKLIAKLILASSNEGDIVLDPFLGSGTTAVVAKKLNRNFLGIELDRYYATTTLKRLKIINETGQKRIQGYENGVFWERNIRDGLKKQK